MFWIHQIKDKIGEAYEGAVQTYNGTDSKSKAVDSLQEKVCAAPQTLNIYIFHEGDDAD